MRARTLRGALAGMGIGLCIAAGATVGQPQPDKAEAMDYYYCGYLVPPKSQCDDRRYSLPLQGNRATYPGSGSVSVCERVERTTGGELISRRCAYGTVASGSDLPNGPSNTAIVGNNDDSRHTVNGKAVTL